MDFFKTTFTIIADVNQRLFATNLSDVLLNDQQDVLKDVIFTSAFQEANTNYTLPVLLEVRLGSYLKRSFILVMLISEEQNFQNKSTSLVKPFLNFDKQNSYSDNHFAVIPKK